jgi:hypothetical protein
MLVVLDDHLQLACQATMARETHIVHCVGASHGDAKGKRLSETTASSLQVLGLPSAA